MNDLIPFNSEVHWEVTQFLTVEAELLDERKWLEWLDLLTDDISYQMPVRVTKEHTLEATLMEHMDHFKEDLYSLRKRVDRLHTEYAWTEDPPSRTRHFITNIRAYRGSNEGELYAKSYILLFRSRGDLREPDLVSAERRDLLRREENGLRLASREIVVDESVLRTQNLAIFL